MRVTAEYIFDATKILVRLLGTPTPLSFVQTGTYVINFFPTRDPISFDVEPDQIVDNEAKIYLAITNTPESIEVTLPDLTVQSAVVHIVKQPTDRILTEQNLETITPHEQPMHQPAHAEFKIDEMSPPEFPPFWVELNLSNADPLRLAPGSISPLVLLTYTGGGAGRVLTATTQQEAADQPPYRIHSVTHFEGAFTNTLPDSAFTSTYVPPGFIDPVPVGWTVQLADPDGLIRTAVNPNPNLLLPTFQIVWYVRPDFQDYSLAPPVVVSTPPVGANEIFQILVEPASTNALGSIQLTSNTGLVTLPYALLDGAKILTINVGVDPGPVRIKWKQEDGDGRPQLLNLVAPMASLYPTPHTLIPFGQSSAADVLALTNVAFTGKWVFTRGFIRIETEQEEIAQPLSWNINFQSGPTLLKVEGGILQSDFSSFTVDIAALLPTDIESRGSYKLKWTLGSQFKLLTKLADQPDQETVIPFALDFPIPDPLLTETVNYEFSSFTPLTGSSRLKYFVFRPE